MILFQRGRPSESTISSMEIDVTVDLRSALTSLRYDHAGPWRPPVDVFETDSALVVRAELAGLTRTHIEVLVSWDELVIRGERSIAQPSSSRRYHESRVRYGPFEAVIRLRFPITVDSASAEYVDGFLSILLPRRPAVRVPSRENGRIVEALRGDQ